MVINMTENIGTIAGSGRDKRGRFTVGNPGKQKGTVSRPILTARQVVADQTGNLVAKALEMALEGNESMLKLFVGRILPKDGFDLGLKPSGTTPLAMVESLFEQYQQDGITAGDLAGHLQLFKVLFDALELQDFKIRLEALEQAVPSNSENDRSVLTVINKDA